MTPSDENECRQMLYTGYHYNDGPSAVRYPRGNAVGVELTPLEKLPIGKGIVKRRGEKLAILNFGTLMPEAAKVAESLNATLVDMRFVKPLDEALILEMAASHEALVTVEENAIMGGAGSGVNEVLMAHRKPVPVTSLFHKEHRKKCAPNSASMPPVWKPKSRPGWHNPYSTPAMLKKLFMVGVAACNTSP